MGRCVDRCADGMNWNGEGVLPGKHVVGDPHSRLNGLSSCVLLRHHLQSFIFGRDLPPLQPPARGRL